MADAIQQKTPERKQELKAKISRYRALARQFTDIPTAENIQKLADEIEQQLRELEKIR